MYMATYSISFILNLKSVLWKLQFEVMLCYRNNSQRRAVEDHKLKESQYSSYSAVLLPAGGNYILLCHTRCMGCFFLRRPNEKL